jgi:hypothetical protein
MRIHPLVLVPAALLVVVFTGCSTLLGDFTISSQELGSDGGLTTADAGGGVSSDGSATIAQDAGTTASDDAGFVAVTDAGESGVRDTGVDAPPCGALGEVCCPKETCADSTLDCINDECHSASTGDLGKGCTDAGACASGVCLGVEGDEAGADAGAVPAVCTNACSPDAGTLYANDAGLGDRCLVGWTCGQSPGSSTPVCTCTRSAEVCNGKDDDCDGVVDNGTSGNTCTTGKLGVCAAGTTTCASGVPGCAQKTQPTTEVCNGLDDDCDGVVDNGTTGGACSTGQKGVCAAGTTTCVSGVAGCAETTAASAEVCNGLDDDCDGNIDNGTTGKSCSTGKPGVCAAGTTTCVSGDPGCAETTAPTAEVCDGLDNNCNGQTDEGNPGGGGSCTASAKGACAIGLYTCTNAAVQCVSQVSPSTAWHYSAASNGSWDWNCDGVVTESEPGGASFWGTSYVNCTSTATYAQICDNLSGSAPVCNGSPVYYHCLPATNGNHCGETYYDFTCGGGGTDQCTFPGVLSGAMTDGCD